MKLILFESLTEKKIVKEKEDIKRGLHRQKEVDPFNPTQLIGRFTTSIRKGLATSGVERWKFFL